VLTRDALGFDGFGSLYVANCGFNCGTKTGSVTVYAPGSGSVLRTISQGVSVPNALGFDGSGNLYVVNYNKTVTVYASGSTSVLRTRSIAFRL
jgi:sugar lactone lactonase YvrE